MNDKFISLLAIILGILIIIFPIMGILDLHEIIGLAVLLISIYLLIVGTSIKDYNKNGSLLNMILGLILLILSIFIIFAPSMIDFLADIIVYLAGILLIITGLITLITERDTRFGFHMGIIGIVLGVVYIILGTYVKHPIVFGVLIGAWLILSGVSKLLDG